MKRLSILLLLAVYGCIGIDEEDAPIVGESIDLEIEQLALLVGDTAKVEAVFFNRYGIEENQQIFWESDDEDVASVDINGTVVGHVAGQSNLIASVGATVSRPLQVTVVEDVNAVAQVTISSPSGLQIDMGQQAVIETIIFNILNEELSGFEITFQSLDPDVISVDQEGTVTGLENGLGRIVAIVEGVYSNTLEIRVGATSRQGNFVGANGYESSGSTELFFDGNGDLILELKDDFETDFALGTFIYLSNSTSGSVTRNEGLELQEIGSGGNHVFNVSDIASDTSIDDFQYVIVLCKPATITFGYAQLD
ncbi:MAG: Ig-like domain-containing protein [Flavobacteriales bacterium]|nr:Ig-like domain-containing protein [Flavobacteriales bacterium]